MNTPSEQERREVWVRVVCAALMSPAKLKDQNGKEFSVEKLADAVLESYDKLFLEEVPHAGQCSCDECMEEAKNYNPQAQPNGQ